jgi:hypothetical protein
MYCYPGGYDDEQNSQPQEFCKEQNSRDYHCPEKQQSNDFRFFGDGSVFDVTPEIVPENSMMGDPMI